MRLHLPLVMEVGYHTLPDSLCPVLEECHKDPGYEDLCAFLSFYQLECHTPEKFGQKHKTVTGDVWDGQCRGSHYTEGQWVTYSLTSHGRNIIEILRVAGCRGINVVLSNSCRSHDLHNMERNTRTVC